MCLHQYAHSVAQIGLKIQLRPSWRKSLMMRARSITLWRSRHSLHSSVNQGISTAALQHSVTYSLINSFPHPLNNPTKPYTQVTATNSINPTNPRNPSNPSNCSTAALINSLTYSLINSTNPSTSSNSIYRANYTSAPLSN